MPNTSYIHTLFVIPTIESDTIYDSDGNCGTSYEQVEGDTDVDEYFEEEVTAATSVVEPSVDESDLVPTDNEINAIYVKNLKPHLKARNLSIKVNKDVLVTRLNDTIRDELPCVENIATEILENMADEGFYPTVH